MTRIGADRRWHGVALALLACHLLLLLRTAWLSDDALITLRTVDNFVHGHGLRWNVAERVQSFTHPAWLLLLSVPYALSGDPFYSVMVPSLAISLAAVALLAFGLAASPVEAALALAALALSRAFVDYSTSGLENPLTHLLLAWFLWLVRDPDRGRWRWHGIGLAAGLLALNRIDSTLLVLPALALLLWRHRCRRRLVAVATGFAPFLAWELFALAYYGVPWPNTALAKLGSGIPAGELAAQGLAYHVASLRDDPLTLAVVGAALLAAALRRRPLELALGLGLMLDLVYVLRIGGDFMAGRFFSAPLFLASAVLASAGLPAGKGTLAGCWCAVLGLGLGLARPAPTVRAGPEDGIRHSRLIDQNGIADERRYYFPLAGLWNTQPGWRRPVPGLTRRGRDLADCESPLAVEGSVGATGYYSGPAVHLVDRHALADPLLARLPMVERDPMYAALYRAQRSAEPPRGWRVGHYLRNLPEGYLATLASGENRISDPAIAALWQRLVLVTRAPLLAPGRLRAIVELNLDRGGALAGRGREPYRPVPWAEVQALRPELAEAWTADAVQRMVGDDHAGARPLLARSLELCPHQFLALTGAADAALWTDRRQEALGFAERAVALDPEAGAGHEMRARALWSLGRHDDAIVALETAVRLDRSLEPSARADMGIIHLARSDPSAAEAALRRSLALAPDQPEVLVELGRALLAGRRPREAMAPLGRALELRGSYSEAVLLLAEARLQAGDRGGAVAELSAHSARHPADRAVRFRLGELLWASGDRSAAVEHWRQAARAGDPRSQRALLELEQGW